MGEEIKKDALKAFEDAKPYLSDFNDFKKHIMEIIEKIETEEEFIDEVKKYKKAQDNGKDRETDVRIFLQKYEKIR